MKQLSFKTIIGFIVEKYCSIAINSRVVIITLIISILGSSDKTRVARDCLHVRRTRYSIRGVRQYAAAILDSVVVPVAGILFRKDE